VQKTQRKGPFLRLLHFCEFCGEFSFYGEKSGAFLNASIMKKRSLQGIVLGATDADLAASQNLQRKAQFYLDFVEAENSTGFHAPQEAARILGESIDFSRQGQIALRSQKPLVK
jgi:Cytochrome c552